MVNDDGELCVKNGTVRLSETDDQNVQLITLAAKGEFKEYPQLGASVLRYRNAVDRQREMKQEIRVNLALDGYADAKVDTDDNNNITVEI